MAKLTGMKAIAVHENRSESTMLGWIRDLEYPATKIGGIWESSTEESEKWHKRQMALSAGLARNKKEEKKQQKEKKIETLI